jgi:hypothetical protein
MYNISICLLFLFTSCSVFHRITSKLEETHYALYKQKVLYVYAVESKKVFFINPTSTHCYFLRGKHYTQKWSPGDTLYIDDNLETFYDLKFAKNCN